MFDAVSLLPENVVIISDELPLQDDELNSLADGDSVWIPESRNPQSLYKAYSGSRDELIQASYEHALTDLYHLKINFVENEKQFNSVMRSLLIQEPIFKLINDFIEEPKRFGAVTKYLKGTLKQDLTREQIDYIWQIIFRWMLHFFPDSYEYSRPNYSEIISKISR